jgi:hypothetical protein
MSRINNDFFQVAKVVKQYSLYYKFYVIKKLDRKGYDIEYKIIKCINLIFEYIC